MKGKALVANAAEHLTDLDWCHAGGTSSKCRLLGGFSNVVDRIMEAGESVANAFPDACSALR